MKKGYYLLCILLTIGIVETSAQMYTTNVPISMPFDSTYVVGQGMVDSFDISQHFQSYSQGQFLLCANSTFTFIGNQSSTFPSFYLMPGATLILKDQYFYPVLYMSANTTLDAKGGFQNIQCYRDSNTTLLDTAIVSWVHDSIYSGMNFTFSAWPNASNPCSLSPNELTHHEQLEPILNIRNRTLYFDLLNNKKADCFLYDMQGQRILKKEINRFGNIDLSHLSSGIYIINISQEGKMAKKKIFLD